MMARVMGRSARRAITGQHGFAFMTEILKRRDRIGRLTAMLCRTLLRILRCTRKRLVVVSAAVISSIDNKKRVRSRSRGKSPLAESGWEE
jgi:hypothetical protein